MLRLKPIHEAISEVERREMLNPTPDERRAKLRKVCLGIVLWPLSLIALITLFELFFDAAASGKLWKDESVWFFAAGCVTWIILSILRVKMTLAYVFAHELTHVIATLLSGGRVHQWDATEDGGFVEANKTSWFITLAPYLVPLYTLIVFALYGCASLAVDLQQIQTVPLGVAHLHVKLAWVFEFWMGVTWAFHVIFTFNVLKTEQSDLTHNGEFFSVMLIFGWNLAVLGVLFITASSVLSWHEAWRDTVQLVTPIWHYSSVVLVWLAHQTAVLFAWLWHEATALFIKLWRQTVG